MSVHSCKPVDSVPEIWAALLAVTAIAVVYAQAALASANQPLQLWMSWQPLAIGIQAEVCHGFRSYPAAML